MADNNAIRRVVIGGASGLIGGTLARSLRNDGVEVTALVRRTARIGEYEWLTDGTPLNPAVLEGVDALVVLNGASIGRLPWTRAYRRTMLWSRVLPVRAAARAVREAGSDAPRLVTASAVAYYGSAPGAVLDEASPAGEGFVSELCVEWEAAARAAGDGARVSTLRTGSVLHPKAMLKPLIPLTRLGLAGPIGRGTQVWPWISLPDAVGAIRHVIDAGIAGPVNLVGPDRATANDIGFALARRLERPYLLRAPEPAVRVLLGRDAAQALLHSDANVIPAALSATGFDFRHPTAAQAIADAVPSP